MKFYKKSDIIILAVIVVISLASWIVYKNVFSKNAAKAEIYYNNKLVKSIDLNGDVDETFSIPQNKNVVFHLYKDGSIAFVKSDCHDKICIKSGRLKIVGETAACLPNKIFLKIVPSGSDNDSGLDGITGK